MDPKKAKKLRALVYTGLAGGLVGVSSYSAAAHGNAYSHLLANDQKITWVADDLVVTDHQQAAAGELQAKAK